MFFVANPRFYSIEEFRSNASKGGAQADPTPWG
jgi:hypothetical protein